MKKKLFFILSSLFLVLAIFASLKYGAVKSSWSDVVAAFHDYDAQNSIQLMIRQLRIPRTMASVVGGAAFAVSGSLMQGVTNNPLADSGLLGINAGAGLGLALVFAIMPSPRPSVTILASFVGAGIALSIIYVASNRVIFAHSSVRMVLLGAAISSFFTAISQSISLFFNLNQDITFWLVGGTGNVTGPQVKLAFPIIILGVLGACFYSREISLLSMGDETAISLGKNPQKIREKALLCVLLLAGTAVSLVGTISFLGLIIPHIVRFFVGHDYKLVIPASAVFGALFFVVADVCSRLIAPPLETPVGVLVTIIGVPLLLLQIRRGNI